MSTEEIYDYVIVGGGTAGLVLANRLSEDPNVSVIVIEAGKNADTDPRVATPGLWSSIHGSEHDWMFATTPQIGLNERRIGHNHGKLMGGSSPVNAQAIIPPSASDLNAWEKLGNADWGWDVMESYVKKPFKVSLPDKETSQHFNITWAEELLGGPNGLVKASFADVVQNPLGEAWVETFGTIGHPLSGSPFSGTSIGPFNCISTICPDTKTRSSSSTSYYQQAASRSNLKVLTECLAQKLILKKDAESEEPRATAVQVANKEDEIMIYARNEVILSAGVFNSPKILELSGIGDPDILKSHNIKVHVANPFVGTNLQDHILTAMSFEAQDEINTGDNMMRKDGTTIGTAMNLYQTQKLGPFATSGITSFCYIPAVDFDKDPEALQSIFRSLSDGVLSHPLDSARRDILRDLLQNGREGVSQYCLFAAQSFRAGQDTVGGVTYEAQSGNFISIVATLAHPLSTGTTHITSPDPTISPRIDHRYLTDPLDLELLARHVRYTETIASTPPFSSTILKPNGRRHDPTAFLNGDLEKAKSFVKSSATTNWHSCGTCAMAPKDKGGVVDTKLRVYGVKGLRIVDASVFPFVPQSNTQALVYAVAERASDIIKGA